MILAAILIGAHMTEDPSIGFRIAIAAALLAAVGTSRVDAAISNIRSVPVDSGGALPGYTTWDILIDFDSNLLQQQLLVDMSFGSIYQHPSGNHLPPSSANVALDPLLAFDTFVALGSAVSSTPSNADIFVEGGAADIDPQSAELTFDDTTLSIAWSPAPGLEIPAANNFLLARITLLSEGTFIYVGTSEDSDPKIENTVISCLGLGLPCEPPADYDNPGQWAQGDLDLVLLNWGKTVPPDPVPVGWINQQPTGLIGQSALDTVLLSWGKTGGSSAALGTAATAPEPATILLFSVALVAYSTRRDRKTMCATQEASQIH